MTATFSNSIPNGLGEQRSRQESWRSHERLSGFIYLVFGVLTIVFFLPFLELHKTFLVKEGCTAFLGEEGFVVVSCVVAAGSLWAGRKILGLLHRGVPTAIALGLLTGVAIVGLLLSPYAVQRPYGEVIVAVGKLAGIVAGSATAILCICKGLPFRSSALRILGVLGVVALVVVCILLAWLIYSEITFWNPWLATPSGLASLYWEELAAVFCGRR